MFKEVSSSVDFPRLENEILSNWKKINLNEQYLKKNKDSKKNFSFVDGPITANNPMGVHHAWGRTYKDLWQKFFNMKGFRQRFQNGFDEQGLWVEVEVEKELNLHTKKDIENLVAGNVFESIAKFVNLCKERVKKFSTTQTEQSKRLGYFMDWDNSYHTSSEQNNYAIWHYLKTVHEKGWLYKGRDSVPWCPRCGTAISQHEILTEEYKEIVHKAVFFKLPLKDRENEFLLVWTTTPWTIPGNVMVAVNPEETYVSFHGKGDEKLWVMEKRLAVFNKAPLDKKIGKELIGWKYTGPFDNIERVQQAMREGEFHEIISAPDLVTAEEGTGLVHIAPGAGEEDFKLHKELGFPVIELIGEDATYINGLGEFSGQNAKKHPELIIEYLEKYESGKFLLKAENYKHRYPTCWRCKTELVWRVVDEWYIAVDKNDPKTKKSYREMMKEVIKDVNWLPSWGYERELDWLNNLHDWLISKKRYWGLALPIWECTKCGNFDVIGSEKELKQKTVVGWQQFQGNSPHRPWVDQIKLKCSKCGEQTNRIPDVGNPWLDAGIVPFSTLNYFEDRSYWKDWFPADFITESFPGQFKNWFYSLIAMSTALENRAPFKTLLGHGSVRDEKGEEMHKSKGNAIWFDEAAEKMGVDAMRWIYATSNPETNVSFGYGIADEVRRRFLLILWNVYSFFVTYANIDKWEPAKARESEHILDKWLVSELNSLVDLVNNSLEKYDAQSGSRAIEDFVINKLSTWYVRRIRDRVGPTVDPGADKDFAYQTLYDCLITVSKLLAPFLPFITEEIYLNLKGEVSVHLQDFPEMDKGKIDVDLSAAMQTVREVAEVGHGQRKEKSLKVRQPLARAEVFLPKEKSSLIKKSHLQKLLADELNIKEIDFVIGDKNEIIVELDIVLSEELKQEGQVRELVRSIQAARKEALCRLDEVVVTKLPHWPKDYTEQIKKETLSSDLQVGEKIEIIRN